MKQAITSGVFAISFVSLFVLGLVSRVQARECSNASIKGTSLNLSQFVARKI